MKLCRWSPALWKGYTSWGGAGISSSCSFWGHAERYSGQISQFWVFQITLVVDTWLDSVSEWEAIFSECFCILAFMSLHEHSAHGFLLSNQVHQSVVEMRGEERPSDSDFAQTKLSLVSKDREEHPQLSPDLSPQSVGQSKWVSFCGKISNSTLVC